MEAILCISILLISFAVLKIPQKYREKQIEEKRKLLETTLITLSRLNILRELASEDNCNKLKEEILRHGFLKENELQRILIEKYKAGKFEISCKWENPDTINLDSISVVYYSTGIYSIELRRIFIYAAREFS